MKEYEIQEAIRRQEEIILENTAKLTFSDYKALKHADGVLSDEEYEGIRLIRQSFRDAINAAQEEIENLRSLTPEEEPHPIFEPED